MSQQGLCNSPLVGWTKATNPYCKINPWHSPPQLWFGITYLTFSMQQTECANMCGYRDVLIRQSLIAPCSQIYLCVRTCTNMAQWLLYNSYLFQSKHLEIFSCECFLFKILSSSLQNGFDKNFPVGWAHRTYSSWKWKERQHWSTPSTWVDPTLGISVGIWVCFVQS